MSLTKVNYVDGETVIEAQNLNDIQDAIIDIEEILPTELDKKENLSNKVTSITSASTDTQYPSAKAVYNKVPTKTSQLTNDSGFLTEVKETNIKWGDAVRDGVTPLDFAAYNEFNPNRLAFMDGSQIAIEKSTDGGATWSDYGGLTAENKQSLVTLSHRLYTGGAATGTGNGNRLRVTINSYSGLYMRTKKLLVNITTNGVSGCKMIIEHSTIGSPDTFTIYKTVDIGGWPGWNSIPYEFVFGGTTQSAQLRKLRLTFYYTTAASSGNQLILDQIRLLGTPSYNTPSTLASTGHMYTYDINKNVTFPANVIASNTLPVVTSADEGKTLKVVNGQWAVV